MCHGVEDENRIVQYYLSDELGSPLRVLYRNGNGEAYGYDEFGVDLYDPGAEQYGGKRYSRQGERQVFGYIGYRHDDINGTYFAQAKGVPARGGEVCGSRFKIKDKAAENTDKVINKIVGVYDDQGQELINRYLYGDGSEYIIDNDLDWNKYMMSNEKLAEFTGNYLAPVGENLKEGESTEVDMQISMILQGDTKTGYMLMYGSTANVGGYQIQGTVVKDMEEWLLMI